MYVCICVSVYMYLPIMKIVRGKKVAEILPLFRFLATPHCLLFWSFILICNNTKTLKRIFIINMLCILHIYIFKNMLYLASSSSKVVPTPETAVPTQQWEQPTAGCSKRVLKEFLHEIVEIQLILERQKQRSSLRLLFKLLQICYKTGKQTIWLMCTILLQ